MIDAYLRSDSSRTDEDILNRLVERYYDIRKGLGPHKNPKVHGAFPTDPYSHTPGGGGARQPGLTGQVKEDILARWAELGVRVAKGCLEFRPALLRRKEFAVDSHDFHWIDLEGRARSLELAAGTLAFTYCQTPVVYHLSDSEGLRVTRASGEERLEGLELPPAISREIFRRSGSVERIDVFLDPVL